MRLTSRRRAATGLPDVARLSPADVFHLGLIGIRTRRLRAALSTVGIAIGIATLVLVIGISGSSNAGLSARLNSLGANLLVAQAQIQNNIPTQFVSDAETVTLRMGPVTSAAELATLSSVVRRNGQIPPDAVAGLNAFAASPTLLSVLHARMQAGAFLSGRTAEMRTVVLARLPRRIWGSARTSSRTILRYR